MRHPEAVSSVPASRLWSISPAFSVSTVLRRLGRSAVSALQGYYSGPYRHPGRLPLAATVHILAASGVRLTPTRKSSNGWLRGQRQEGCRMKITTCHGVAPSELHSV